MQCLVMSSSFVDAQEPQKNPDLISASFAQYSFGTHFHHPNRMTEYLEQDDILGPSYSSSINTYSFGSEISIFVGRVMLGIGGTAMTNLHGYSSKGSTNLRMGGVYAKTGYMFLRRKYSNVYAFTGFGIMDNTLDLHNSSDSSRLYFDERQPVRPGPRGTYKMDCFLIDMGIAFKTLAIRFEEETEKDSRGGLLLGLEAGCLLFMPADGWKSNHTTLEGIPGGKPYLTPYIKLTIGTGGFYGR